MVEYKLVRIGSDDVLWTKTITSEHDYEQPLTTSGVLSDTLKSAFETAVRQNLESLLIQLDAYEQGI